MRHCREKSHLTDPMKSSEHDEASVRLNEHVACSMCGRFGAVELGNQYLCPNCYEACGSCCPEFGREELEARAAQDNES